MDKKLYKDKIYNTFEKNGDWYFSQVYKAFKTETTNTKEGEYWILPLNFIVDDKKLLIKLIKHERALKLLKTEDGKETVTKNYNSSTKRELKTGVRYIRLNSFKSPEMLKKDLRGEHRADEGFRPKDELLRYNFKMNTTPLNLDNLDYIDKEGYNHLLELDKKINDSYDKWYWEKAGINNKERRYTIWK